VITREGQTYVFATPEEAREFVSQPLSDAELAQGLRAIDMIRELNEMILRRTGGQGISEEDMEEALRVMRDH
jgi:hypothetical protein